jgi:hypothetical protein
VYLHREHSSALHRSAQNLIEARNAQQAKGGKAGDDGGKQTHVYRRLGYAVTSEYIAEAVDAHIAG